VLDREPGLDIAIPRARDMRDLSLPAHHREKTRKQTIVHIAREMPIDPAQSRGVEPDLGWVDLHFQVSRHSPR
jgi:hypothetical protein